MSNKNKEFSLNIEENEKVKTININSGGNLIININGKTVWISDEVDNDRKVPQDYHKFVQDFINQHSYDSSLESDRIYAFCSNPEMDFEAAFKFPNNSSEPIEVQITSFDSEFLQNQIKNLGLSKEVEEKTIKKVKDIEKNLKEHVESEGFKWKHSHDSGNGLSWYNLVSTLEQFDEKLIFSLWKEVDRMSAEVHKKIFLKKFESPKE